MILKLSSIVSHLGTESGTGLFCLKKWFFLLCFRSICLGHYVCDVYDDRTKSWFTFDDDKVSIATEDGVLSNRQKTSTIFFYLSIWMCGS